MECKEIGDLTSSLSVQKQLWLKSEIKIINSRNAIQLGIGLLQKAFLNMYEKLQGLIIRVVLIIKVLVGIMSNQFVS